MIFPLNMLAILEQIFIKVSENREVFSPKCLLTDGWKSVYPYNGTVFNSKNK